MKVLSIYNKKATLSQIAGLAKQQSTTLTAHLDADGKLDGVQLPVYGLRAKTRQGNFAIEGVYTTSADTVQVTAGAVSITCTLSHRLYVEGRGWTAAGDLCCDDSLVLLNGTNATVTNIRPSGKQEVMDICVADVHEYYANGIVSHNSILANQLNINQASFGYKTSLVPLEMSTQEMLARSSSSVSGQSSIDIFLKRLATGEKDAVWKKFTRFDRKVAKANGRYTIFKPREDMSIEELMAALHTFNSDVTYVDYIGLLKGADGEDQWRKLGQIARFGKIHAENTNRVVVMLAQINEEGKLRYSQAVKEHSSLAWTFVATKESKERGYLNIELLKSRNQVDRPFTLGIDYAQMKVRDLQPDELQKIDAVDKKKADGKKVGATAKGGKTSDYVPDLTE